MEPEKTPYDRAEDLISLLLGWRPIPHQGVWVLRLAVVLVVLVAIGRAYDVTLLDWLKLLIVPAAIAGVGIWFNRQQRGRELEIARQRREQVLSREELAEKVGSHRDHIGRLERGEVANPRMATIRNLAQALEVDPSELVE